MLDIVQLPLGAYQTNCYLVAREGASDAVVVDPGDAPETVLAALAERGWTAAAVLVTHGHFDHLGAVKGVAEAAGVEVWMPRDEADELRTLAAAPHEPDHLLDGGETVSAAGIEFDTMSVPGHSSASIAYHADGHLFSGDVLFSGSVGRTDFAGGDMADAGREHRPADGRLPARHGGAARARPGDDARPRARAEPVPGSAARMSQRVPVPARHARLGRPAGGAAAIRARRGAARVRDRRLRPGGDADVRGHRRLPAHVGRGLRRRAQGDVQLPRPQRPRADAAPRGHRRRHAAPTSSTG